MKALILAAGKGTRMSPLGETTPKLLTPIFNTPLIHRFLDIFENCEEIIFIIAKGEYGEKIKSYASSIVTKQKLSFVEQEEVTGTGRAILYAEKFFEAGEKFFTAYGDDIYAKKDVQRLLQYKYGVIGQKVTDPEKWGIFHADENGFLTEIIEKPEEFVGDIANIGVYLVNTKVFDLAKHIEISPRGEYELTDVITNFAKVEKVKVLAVEDYWIPVGYPWHIFNVHEKLIDEVDFKIEGIVEDGVQIKGRLKLGKNSVIKSGCYLEGDIIVGENVVIGPNAYIRGKTVLGNGCRVGAFCEVKNSVLFENTFISHLVFCGDSIIGNNSNLSAGTITNVLYPDWKINPRNIQVKINEKFVDSGRQKLGSIIGDNVNIAAGTILLPGVKIGKDVSTDLGEVVKEGKYKLTE